MPAELKRNWSLHRDAFRKLLLWLDEGSDSSGENYVEMRRRLVSYFVRKNCLAPDDLADETLTRVARRLEEEGTIADTPPARYCFIVAKFIFLEYQRRGEHRHISFDELPGPVTGGSAVPDDAPEKLLGCLQGCLRKLEPDQRALIWDYYRGEKAAKIAHRRELAERLGLTANAMAIRACRIRDRLEGCVRTCSAEK